MQTESSAIVIGPPLSSQAAAAYADPHTNNTNGASLDGDLSRRAGMLLLSSASSPPYYHGDARRGDANNEDGDSATAVEEAGLLRHMRWLPVAVVVYIILANFVLTIIVLIQLLALGSRDQLGHDTISKRISSLNQTAWGLSAHTELVDGELYDLGLAMNSVGEAMMTLQAENALIFNSTEHSRHGLLLLVKLLAQIIQPAS